MRNKAILIITIIAAFALSATGAIGRGYAIDIVPTPTPELTTWAYFPLVGNQWSDTMRMTGFGDSYDSAYTFGLALMEDSWGSTRSNPLQPVSGADGAFRYYGKKSSPIMPVTAVKKFALTSSVSSADIEDQLMELRAATIAKSYSILWWLDRDGSTVYWNYAECTGLKDADTYKEKGRWMKKVELTFQIESGVWYGQTQQSWSNTMVIPASTVGRAATGLTNDGNVNAMLDVRIVPHDSLTVEDSAAGVLGVSQWEFGASFTDPEQLLVTASEYKCVTDEIIESKSFAATLTATTRNVWGDGRFVYAARSEDGIASYSVDAVGAFTLEDTDDQGASARDVWGDGQFVFLANLSGGLLSYSVDSAGQFTLLDTNNTNTGCEGVWGDGRFIYLAASGQGLSSYSVDDAGVLTHIDTDDQGDDYISVWGDGTFIYVTTDGNDVLTYSVDDSGVLTFIGAVQGGEYSVWGDGKLVYVAAGGLGLFSYSVDSDGALTNIDTDDQGGVYAGVWGDGTFIYVANDTLGILVYSVNDVGELTYLYGIDPGGAGQGVWGDGTFIYLANDTSLRSYASDLEANAYTSLDVGEGALLNRTDIDQNAWLWLPPGTTQFNVVVDCDAGGGAEEVDVYVTWWNTYVF